MSKRSGYPFRPIVCLILLLSCIVQHCAKAQSIFKNNAPNEVGKRSVRPLLPLSRERQISVRKSPFAAPQKITLTTIDIDEIPSYNIPQDVVDQPLREEKPVAIVTPAKIPPPPTATKINHYDAEVVRLLRQGIAKQQSAGYRNYQPNRAYVVDPSKQTLSVVNLHSWTNELTIPVGTGKNGIGFGSAQTPTGFFTMGGVRIAKKASAYIQTGDSKTGVSGVYAEILYPPSDQRDHLRGRVPNNVIIHGFNPSVSHMLKERHEKDLIGRVPCTTGCPVPRIDDLPKLASFLQASAGSFDPGANPNANLRTLIRKRKVIEYENTKRLGDPILILDRAFH